MKKVYSIQDKPQTKQEAWLHRVLRIKARVDSRYIYITNRIQLLALLDNLYAFIIPSTSVPSEFNILSTKTKTRILLPKIKDYLDKNIKDPFLKRFSPKILAHLLKSNLRHHLRNEIQNLWNTLVNARLEFSNLLIMLLSDEVFGSGLLPAGTQPEEILLVMEDLKNYKSRKARNSADYHVNPLWNDLEDTFVQQHRTISKARDSLITSKRKLNKNKTNKKNTSSNPKYKVDKKTLSKQLHRAKYRLFWLNKAIELDTYQGNSRKNSLWSHGQLKEFLEQEFHSRNLIQISPAYTSQRCMWCDKIGNRQGEMFTCDKNPQCLFYAIPVHDDINASGVITNDYLNYYRKHHESKLGKS